MRELVECRESKLVFDYGMIAKSRIAFPGFIDMFFPADLPWRALVLDDDKDVGYEWTPNGQVNKYPYWDATKHDFATLENMVADNAYVPILVPGVSNERKRSILGEISDIQADYPGCKILYHNNSGFSVFGYNFGALDFDARVDPAHNRVFQPDGRKIENASERIQPGDKWLGVLGFQASDMIVPRNRCMYQIKSVVYAGKYYNENRNIKQTRSKNVDYKALENVQATRVAPKVRLPQVKDKINDGDYYVCNACGLQNKCDYFRRGAVCSVPGSEPTQLSKYFGTRDSDVILDGLSNLLQFQANRVMQKAEEEASTGEIDPELTKMVNGLFDRGVKMAKLVDPALGKGPAVGVFINNGVPSPGVGPNAKSIVAGMIRELESRGVPRDQITPQMIEGLLMQTDPKAAIEGAVISSKQVS